MDKFLKFLGIAKKSGNLIEGYSKCDEARNKNKIFLFILSYDLSESSRKKFIKHCVEKKVPYIENFSKFELGDSIGREEIMILGVCDKNIADKLITLYEEEKIYE